MTLEDFVLRIAATLLSALLLSGCTSAIVPVVQSADGFDAIEFQRATQVRDHAINIYTFNAGGRFIADRYGNNGQKTYCGQAIINGDGRPVEVCLGIEEPLTIVIGPGAGFKEAKRPQPAGTFKHIKIGL